MNMKYDMAIGKLFKFALKAEQPGLFRSIRSKVISKLRA